MKWYWIIPICIAIIGYFGIFWTLSLSNIEVSFEMDNNTRAAIESIEYPIANINEQPEKVCYSEICHLDLEEIQIGGCSMSKVDCKLWEDKYGFALHAVGEQDG